MPTQCNRLATTINAWFESFLDTCRGSDTNTAVTGKHHGNHFHSIHTASLTLSRSILLQYARSYRYRAWNASAVKTILTIVGSMSIDCSRPLQWVSPEKRSLSNHVMRETAARYVTTTPRRGDARATRSTNGRNDVTRIYAAHHVLGKGLPLR